MRDPNRIDEILSELRKYWKANPDLRLGQIISNFSSQHNGNSDPFYMEDDILLKLLKKDW